MAKLVNVVRETGEFIYEDAVEALNLRYFLSDEYKSFERKAPKDMRVS